MDCVCVVKLSDLLWRHKWGGEGGGGESESYAKSQKETCGRRRGRKRMGRRMTKVCF